MDIIYSNTYEDLVDMYTCRYLNDEHTEKVISSGRSISLIIVMLSSFIVSLLIFKFSEYNPLESCTSC